MKNGVAIKPWAIMAVSLSMLSGGVYADDVQSTQTMEPSTQSTGTQMSADKSKIAGEAFLAANKAKPGVVTLPSGLQYKMVKEGTGTAPKATDTVTVNYAGTLIDGTEFDSSYKRGEPATFPVNGVIAGWTEALQLMKPGSEVELYIPASLAYGTNGAPPVIGPNQTLIFKVELLKVN